MSVTRKQTWRVFGTVALIIMAYLGVAYLQTRPDGEVIASTASVGKPVQRESSDVRTPYASVILPNDRVSPSAMSKVFPNAGKPASNTIKREVETLPQPAEKSVAKAKPVTYMSTSMIYVVKAGDWLSTICPSDWPKVAVVNNLANPDRIYPGQKLELTEKCSEVEFVARRGSTKTTLVVAQKTKETVSPAKAEKISPALVREEKVSEKPSTALVRQSVSTVSGETIQNRKGTVGLSYCEIDALPFKWRQPGINPIFDDDPKEYLDCLAQSEGLPDEAREYFLAELRKGDQGDFVQVDLRDGEFLKAMVGKKVNGKIRVHQNTTQGWSVNFYKENSPISSGVRRKQTPEEKRLNGTARKYVLAVGSTRWVLMRAYICGNLILRREEISPPVAVAPPEPAPIPIQTPHYTGTCVPWSRPQDCAMPGCVLRSHSDATPACAASCESAPEMNSSPVASANRMHPVVDGTCSLSDARPDETPRATFTVLGGAFIDEKDPEKICRKTPDVEYRGLQLVCLADGTVERGK